MTLKRNFQLILVLWTVLECIIATKLVKRVILGSDAPEDRYKWAASMKGDLHKDKGVTVCGATWIHKQWLLSAAHCFYVNDGATTINLTDPSLWHIRAGSRKIQTQYRREETIDDENWHKDDDYFEELSSDFSQGLDIMYDYTSSTDRKRSVEGHVHMHIKKIILHPKYNGGEIEWDIALLKLEYPVKEKYLRSLIQIIDLPKKYYSKYWPRKGQICILIGWGCKSHQGNVAERGQMASLKVVTNRYCEKVYNQGADLNRRHEFCAGSVNSGHGLCDGDSGSGLACLRNNKWVLAGIASATHAENPANYPGLFTRVSYFIPWIKRMIAKK